MSFPNAPLLFWLEKMFKEGNSQFVYLMGGVVLILQTNFLLIIMDHMIRVKEVSVFKFQKIETRRKEFFRMIFKRSLFNS